uniref:Geranylgeranyl transferase type-2 subunit beta n=1 Tax=Globodera pallida TaxID=36090 RepID=A0A183CJF7_GLOPA
MSLASIWNISRRDVDIPKSAPTELLNEKQKEFILSCGKDKNSYEYIMAEYLRMSGIYWCVAALKVLGNDMDDQEELVNVIKKAQNEDGGFAAADGHDSHLLHTLSAIQVAVIINKLDIQRFLIDRFKRRGYFYSLQQEDGSFAGDRGGEIDTRFSFCAIAALYFLNRLDSIDLSKAVEFVTKCYNFDGGFGTRPGSESVLFKVYCCLGTLAICGSLELIDVERTAFSNCFRQCPSGGLCGRPEKLPDVCYSWWVLASLAILGRLHWVDGESLTRFIIASQDDEKGGIADRPGDEPDPFHTVFGLSGLSLLGYKGLEPVDPVFCMTKKCLKDFLFLE